MVFNELQSTEETLNISSYPDEIREQFYDFLSTVPYIKSLISVNRPRAKDLPRDEEGKIIVDITKPHILENMDYFRPAALHFQKYGCYTLLRPNPNPNSEYGKWVKEEVRRCRDGYVREYDGEWVTGDMYFFLNYCPIQKTKTVKGKMGIRALDFPDVWEGHYYKFHYILQARLNAKHGSEMASRSKGKSFTLAALAAKRYVFGESAEANKNTETFIAAYRKDYLNDDGVMNKFESYIDFIAENTEFPSRRRLSSSINQMKWQAGYIDADTGTKKGTKNEVIGVSVKDSPGKLRGKRGALIGLEEFGSFPNLMELYGTLRPSMEEGDIVFGMIWCQGTAGDKDSDFSAASKIMYEPRAFNMQPIPNVYDKEGQARKEFVFFFPAYMNRKGCYDHNGNSDVTKALLEVLINRYNVKYNSSDLTLITKTVAEHPIVPQEALLRARGNMFPVTALNERLLQIDTDPAIYSNTYTGNLVQHKDGSIEFQISDDMPIREFPLKEDDNPKGCVEIYEMPKKDSSGKVYPERYILGHDPVDDDVANSSVSLTSTFVLDLFTDRIVAEYTGRQDFADDNFEILRRLCLFYNGKCMYEQNKKGAFAYFSKMNCVHLLADTPEYLRDKQLIKEIGYGNKAKGINATAAINNFANSLIRDWLLKPTVVNVVEDGEDKQVTVSNLYTLKNRALIKELIAFNPDINVDRVRALGMVMLYREEKMILYQGNISEESMTNRGNDYLGNDDYFTRNYKEVNLASMDSTSKFRLTTLFNGI